MSKTGTFTRGFSLIETLIAFMLVGIMGGAVVYLLAQVVSVTRSADLKGQATSFANQGIEAVRDYYQTNQWLTLAGKDTITTDSNFTCYKSIDFSGAALLGTSTEPVCGAFDSTKSETINGSGGGVFYRQVGVRTTPASAKAEVSVVVYFFDKGQQKNVKVGSIFYNY